MTSETEIARLIYTTAYAGYNAVPWEQLPSTQKWRWIRVANAVLDRLETTA